MRTGDDIARTVEMPLRCPGHGHTDVPLTYVTYKSNGVPVLPSDEDPSQDKPLSLTEKAYRELRSRLISLEIPPGSPLNEEALLRDLGVGRTPIREALKRLETDHLVVTYPKRGTFATTVELTDLANLIEVREVLEPRAAELAAKKASSPARAEMRAYGAELRSVDASILTPRRVMELDKRVHGLIYAAAMNSHLAATLTRFDNLANRIWNVFLDRLPGEESDGLSEFAAILDAVADGDAVLAADLMRKHIVEADAKVRAVL